MRTHRTRARSLAALCVVLHALVLTACSDAGVTPDCSKVECGPSSVPAPKEDSDDDDDDADASDETGDEDTGKDAGKNSKKSGG